MFALHHATLMAGHRPTGDEAEIFDAHVLACVLASALESVEAGEGDLVDATGLDGATLRAMVDHWFPQVDPSVFDVAPVGTTTVEMEEEMLRDLLLAHGVGLGAVGDHAGATSGAPTNGVAGAPRPPHLPTILAAVVARRAMKPDHLWQDLGLFDRSDLNRLLARHFPTLHAGNTANMKWKKYFYRKLCEAEGFVLCTAPSCAQCNDFAVCFGAEDGESRMAKTRRAADLTQAP